MCATRLFACATLTLFALATAGCDCVSRITAYEHRGDEDADLIRTSYNAVDCLLSKTTQADPNRRILVATVVNLDDVRDTSTFGRLLGEFLAARFSHHDYAVVHMTIREGSVVIKEDGEFLLSRDMAELARDYNAAVVLVSTYTLATDQVFVSVKLVDAASKELVAAVDFAIPKGPQTLGMLGYAGSSSTDTKPKYYDDYWDDRNK